MSKILIEFMGIINCFIQMYPRKLSSNHKFEFVSAIGFYLYSLREKLKTYGSGMVLNININYLLSNANCKQQIYF